jgi:hypothetical protein
MHTRFWWRKLTEKDQFEDLGVDAGIFKKRDRA